MVPPAIVQGQGDLQDGAGAIDAAWATSIVPYGYDNDTVCGSNNNIGDSCWWRWGISSGDGWSEGTELHRRFMADEGDLIRIAIAWYSSADATYTYDSLMTELNLNVYAPNDHLTPMATSSSLGNNYEMVQFVAPMAGEYTIGVYKDYSYEQQKPSGYCGGEDPSRPSYARDEGLPVSQ